MPESHKTEHHGRERVIFIGPKAQDVLRPYLLRDKIGYCFVPAESGAKAECREAGRPAVAYDAIAGRPHSRSETAAAAGRSLHH